MALYKANAVSFIGNRLVPVGETVEYDGIPGTNLDPVDDEGRTAKEAADAGRKRRAGLRAADGSRPIEMNLVAPDIAPDRRLVEIPDDWKDLAPEQRINLARKLGAPVKGTGAKQAETWIENELARRETV